MMVGMAIVTTTLAERSDETFLSKKPVKSSLKEGRISCAKKPFSARYCANLEPGTWRCFFKSTIFGLLQLCS